MKFGCKQKPLQNSNNYRIRGTVQKMSSKSSDASFVEVRQIIKREFHKGSRPAEINARIKSELGAEVSRGMICRWLTRFRSGALTIQHRQNCGRRAKTTTDDVKAVIDDNPTITATELYAELNLGRSTALRYMKVLDVVNNNKMWVPRVLTEELTAQRLDTCSALFERYQRDPFLDRVIFEGKRIIYYNVRNRSTTSARKVVDMKQQVYKVGLQVWWDSQGIILYKLSGDLQFNQEEYIRQLDILHAELAEKRPHLRQQQVIIHHNCTRHLNEDINKHIHRLGWEQIPHPEWCPDISPTNYGLFLYFQYALHLKVYTKLEEIELFVYNFFETRKRSFFATVIAELPERWCKVLDRNGEYIETNEKD